jgi:hypothetical protein
LEIYVSNFRVLFDYFYPGLIPGNVTNVPSFVVDHWYEQYLPLVLEAVRADSAKALQLLSIAKAPYDVADTNSITKTFDQVLWYHAFGTEDAKRKMGGNPFGNWTRVFRGSANDAELNRKIPRIAPDPRAWLNVQPYESTGFLTRPLVTLHTTGDEVIPFWNEQIYAAKNMVGGTSAFLKVIPVHRYGHCEFELNEVLTAVALLVAETRPCLIDPAVFDQPAKTPPVSRKKK